MRRALVIGCLVVMLAGCGGDQLSLAEYSDTLGALAGEMSTTLNAGDEQMTSGTPTVETAREVLAQAIAARAEFQQAIEALDPPDEIANLHADLVELHARMTSAQREFATRADTTSDLNELEQSAEAQAYRAMGSEAEALCHELKARIDATAGDEIFADVPWIPGDLKEVVEATFGC